MRRFYFKIFILTAALFVNNHAFADGIETKSTVCKNLSPKEIIKALSQDKKFNAYIGDKTRKHIFYQKCALKYPKPTAGNFCDDNPWGYQQIVVIKEYCNLDSGWNNQ